MKNPDDRSPREWAEELRSDGEWASKEARLLGGIVMSPADCDELAQRMDDLEEALRLLREAEEADTSDSLTYRPAARRKLLARYEEGGQ